MIVQCFRNTSRVYGLPLPDREGIVGNIGMTLRKQMECYFGKLSDDLFNEYRKTHMAFQLKIYREHLQLCPGVTDALQFLHERRKPCAVVTSRMPETLTVYLRETGIYHYFSALITPQSTARHKPDPEPVLEALKRLDGVPEQTLFTGDSAFDIECGNRAGVATAFVTWSHNPVELLSQTPDYYFSDMRDLSVW